MSRLFPFLMITLLALSACDETIKDDKQNNDPLDAQIHTLDNGLTIYMSVNKDEPRIYTAIAVKAGSKYDPSETTGLAHYLEHMVFKGTHNIGTINWEEEKKHLQAISDAYEAHKAETDPGKKATIYAKIDSLSFEASKYAIPNEYDKMTSSLGAKGTNAYTSNDETVYINDIPSNELEKWISIEGERFQTLVLRLFHTELETVYEEFNRNQDTDRRWSYQAIMKALFPNHPYGTQTTIGEGEHLKNPSMVNIHHYFDTYYVPNNVAICIAGDFDPDQALSWIKESFGKWEPKEVPEFEMPEKYELSEPVFTEVFGPQEEHVYLGFAFEGEGSKEALMLKLIDNMMANGQAGLIDLNLNQKQLLQSAGSFNLLLKDRAMHLFYGRPKAAQDLEEVSDLLLAEVEKIKQGNFDNDLMEAVINNLKLDRIKRFESNRGRAFAFVDAFINERNWQDVLDDYKAMEQITKQDIIDFANKHYGNNYAVVYKRLGEPNRHKVEKPVITPIQMNRDTQSLWQTDFQKMESPKIDAVFVDFENDINRAELSNGIPFSYIENNTNETFDLYYIFDMGRDHDKMLHMAIQYLPFLGTSTYSAEDLQKEFYKLGLSFDVNSSRDQVYVKLSGLESSFEEGIALFEHVLANVQVDGEAYQNLVGRILKARADAKLDKNAILRSALVSYAKYGPQSPFTNISSEEELRSINPEDLVEKIHTLSGFEHRVFYYGASKQEAAMGIINKHHQPKTPLKSIPAPMVFEHKETTKNTLYYVNYDMVQTEMIMLSKSDSYTPALEAPASVFNEYFGAGLSSIVFQEIREQKGLAYAAYAWFTTPKKKEDPHYVQAYLGTQTDKLKDAVPAMMALMNEMPEVDAQFNGAVESVKKKLETDRTIKSSIYWSYETAKDKGLDYDIREQVYDNMQSIDMAQLRDFFNKEIKGNNYTFLLIGNKKQLDMAYLNSLADVKELSLEEVFGY